MNQAVCEDGFNGPRQIPAQRITDPDGRRQLSKPAGEEIFKVFPGNGPLTHEDQVLEMFSHRLAVTEVMMVFDQGIEESLLGQSSHLPDDKLRQAAKIDLDGGLIEARAIRFLSPDQRIVRRTALGGKLDLAGPLQLQQERPADHIAQLTVGLDPVPCLTEPLGELSAAVGRMLRDEALDEGDILIRNDSVSVLQLCVHTPANRTGGTGT